MFEKEAEEYVIKKHNIDITKQPVDFSLRCEFPEDFTDFQRGAEFGYKEGIKTLDDMTRAFNREHRKYTELRIANEWHYVKDGDLPSDFGNYVVCFYGAKDSVANGKPCWEELCFDAETLRWIDRDTFEDLPYINKEGIVIAWKEIVLPELPKESE